MTSRRLRGLLGIVGCVMFLGFAGTAQAADSIWWSNYGAGVSFASLSGGGGGDLNTTGAATSGPYGTAIDTANGRVYWADYDSNQISYANLDGSGGGGQLNLTGATVSSPDGLVLDQATGRIYWGNRGGTTISYANLDGSGGGDLVTTGTTVSAPSGLAIDTANGRIYWANVGNSTISYANLNDTGAGGTLPITSSYVTNPQGVAIDVAGGKIYWANPNKGTVGYANLNGSGAGSLNTTGATTSAIVGVTLDLASSRVYWANFGDGISDASLGGTGGSNFNTTGATTNNTAFPVILKAPAGTGKPKVSGGSSSGAALTCSKGSWAADDLGALVYDSPHSYTYRWSRNGKPISGATASSIKASKSGSYVCTVTATNHAGSASQASVAHKVKAKSAKLKIATGSARESNSQVPVLLKCSGPKGTKCDGTLTLSGGVNGRESFKVPAGHSATVHVKVTGTGSKAHAVARMHGRVAATREITITRATPTFTG